MIRAFYLEGKEVFFSLDKEIIVFSENSIESYKRIYAFQMEFCLLNRSFMYIYGYHFGDSGMHSKAVIAYNLLKCKNTIIMFFFGAIISRRKFSSNCLSTKHCFAITIKCCLINFFSSFRFLGKITWCCRFRFLSFCEKKLAVSKHVPL